MHRAPASTRPPTGPLVGSVVRTIVGGNHEAHRLLTRRRWAQACPLPYSGDVSESGPITQHRAERILAYMFVGIVGLSILAFIAVMVATFAGVGANDGFSQGIWPIVLTLPLFGLPIGFLLLVALLIVNGVRRARETRSGSS